MPKIMPQFQNDDTSQHQGDSAAISMYRTAVFETFIKKILCPRASPMCSEFMIRCLDAITISYQLFKEMIFAALLPIIFSKTCANEDKISCFNRFCLPKDYDKDVAPARNYTIKLAPIIQDIYEASLFIFT